MPVCETLLLGISSWWNHGRKMVPGEAVMLLVAELLFNLAQLLVEEEVV